MFSYFSPDMQVRLLTDCLVIRLATKQDAYRLADYYVENRDYLCLWEPRRDESYYLPSGWQARLAVITELHRQNESFYFIVFDAAEKEMRGIIHFSNIVRGAFHACYLGYSLGEKWQGKGVMYQAAQAALRYMFRKQRMHRIMANYMPRNGRSANLLKRLGFVEEGYARSYLLINDVWEDHVLTALINPVWKPVR